MMNKIEQGDVAAGKGPGVTYGPAVQNNLLQRIIDTAEDKKIPLQRMAASRFTGTDTDAFAYSNMGVASALISLPLRYMHTTVEMVHKQDVEDCIRLIYETLQNIKVGEDFQSFEDLVRPAAELVDIERLGQQGLHDGMALGALQIFSVERGAQHEDGEAGHGRSRQGIPCVPGRQTRPCRASGCRAG